MTLNMTDEAAGLGTHRNANFARDMVLRVERGRSFTAGQRKWVMSILNEPLPVAADIERYEAIRAAASVEGLKHRTKDVLEDFAIKVFNGWNISEKATVFLNNMIAEADAVRANGPWIPTAPQLDDIRSCVMLSSRYKGFYLQSHPGLSSAIQKGSSLMVHMSEGGSLVKSLTESYFDEWCMNKLLKQFKTSLSELAHPKHPAGEMRYTITHCKQTNQSSAAAIIIVSEPVIDEHGQICYPAIVDGALKNVSSDRISKRRPRTS